MTGEPQTLSSYVHDVASEIKEKKNWERNEEKKEKGRIVQGVSLLHRSAIKSVYV